MVNVTINNREEYFLFLSPFFGKLSDKERELIEELIDIIKEVPIAFDDKAEGFSIIYKLDRVHKDMYCKRNKYSKNVLNNMLYKLRKKKVIKNNIINPLFTSESVVWTVKYEKEI